MLGLRGQKHRGIQLGPAFGGAELVVFSLYSTGVCIPAQLPGKAWLTIDGVQLQTRTEGGQSVDSSNQGSTLLHTFMRLLSCARISLKGSRAEALVLPPACLASCWPAGDRAAAKQTPVQAERRAARTHSAFWPELTAVQQVPRTSMAQHTGLRATAVV